MSYSLFYVQQTVTMAVFSILLADDGAKKVHRTAWRRERRR